MQRLTSLFMLATITLSAQSQTECSGSHDVNGNGTVDIEDFLSILGVFGDIDTDEDGVWDSIDMCQDTDACNFMSNPTEACQYVDVVGFCGGTCPSDADGDGVCDFAECGDPYPYSGYDYTTVLIGEQCWFAENLQTLFYSNGDSIPSQLSNSAWVNSPDGASSIFGEGESDCSTVNWSIACDDAAWSLQEFGRLYNWYAVDDDRGLCPAGWHVPSDEEWDVIVDVLGGESVAGQNMKATSGWGENNGSNSSGFGGLPGGYRNNFSGGYEAGGLGGYYWSSTSYASLAWLRGLSYWNDSVERNAMLPNFGFNVRCVRD